MTSTIGGHSRISTSDLKMSRDKSKSKGVIFDLDECLLHSVRNASPELERMVLNDADLMDLRSRYFSVDVIDYKVPKGTGTSIHMWGVMRPHLKEFLLFCRSYFDVVGVWSAGSYDYVHECVDRIFGDLYRPDVIFTWDDIEYLPSGEYYKPLTKILNHPSIKDRVDIGWTFLLDDRDTNFTTQEVNGVHIPQYEPAPSVPSMRSDDLALIQLRQWLSKHEVMTSNDIRTLDKGGIFTTPLSMGIFRSPQSPGQSTGTLMELPQFTSIKYPSIEIPLFSTKPQYIRAEA
jgi:hypothetical protein